MKKSFLLCFISIVLQASDDAQLKISFESVPTDVWWELFSSHVTTEPADQEGVHRAGRHLARLGMTSKVLHRSINDPRSSFHFGEIAGGHAHVSHLLAMGLLNMKNATDLFDLKKPFFDYTQRKTMGDKIRNLVALMIAKQESEERALQTGSAQNIYFMNSLRCLYHATVGFRKSIDEHVRAKTGLSAFEDCKHAISLDEGSALLYSKRDQKYKSKDLKVWKYEKLTLEPIAISLPCATGYYPGSVAMIKGLENDLYCVCILSKEDCKNDQVVFVGKLDFEVRVVRKCFSKTQHDCTLMNVKRYGDNLFIQQWWHPGRGKGYCNLMKFSLSNGDLIGIDLGRKCIEPKNLTHMTIDQTGKLLMGKDGKAIFSYQIE